MKPREVIDRTTTADGESLELASEGGVYILCVAGVPLMSSCMSGSEQAMASVAREELEVLDHPRVLIGGLGMGFTARAALDQFGADAVVVVAELLGAVVDYNRGPLADLAGRPLEDPRLRLHQGDVRACLRRGDWDVILMDVDNGPTGLTSKKNNQLYGRRGVDLMSGALNPGGVLVVWSASPGPEFAERLRSTGLTAYTQTVRGRWPLAKGPRHTLFVAIRPL